MEQRRYLLQYHGGLQTRKLGQIKDVNVKYMTLKMPEGHNPTVFGAVMRMPKDLKFTFRCPILASDQCFDISKEVAAHQWKKFAVP